MSSASGGERVPFEIEDLKDTEVLNDMVGVAGGKAVEVAPVVNEVAIAAADSFSPVAALQYLVDYVHCYTGFNWWASIVVTTLLLRLIYLPFLIHQRKVVTKHYKFLKQQLRLAQKGLKWKGLKWSMQNLDDTRDIEKTFAALNNIGNKIGKFHFLGWLIADSIIPCIFFFSILNMAEKVPSFATGGTLWFTDLTSPDRICLPILVALTLWIKFEMATPKVYQFVEALALLGTVTLGFPKAIYFYWITGNLSSIVLLNVMMDPLVQKWLGISTDKKTP